MASAGDKSRANEEEGGVLDLSGVVADEQVLLCRDIVKEKS